MTHIESPGFAADVSRSLATRSVAEAVRLASDHLLNHQSEAGFWVGELEADTTLESDYILLQLWLHQPSGDGEWRPPRRHRIEKAARYILERQSPEGGWPIYHGGPDNVSASVKAYFALKLVGLPDSELALAKARRRVVELGGVEAANSYTKIYLSYFGLFDRDKTPSIPPEVFFLEKTSRINIYEISSWSRTILAPLAILGAKRAARKPPAGFTLQEICTGQEPEKPKLVSWRSFFLWADKSLKLWEKLGLQPVRQRAAEAAARWMLDRLEDSDGLSAIFPAMMNSIMALTELGYSIDDPLLAREIARFEDLIIEDEETLRLQPCHSPVWDSAISVYALGVANPQPGPRLEAALQRAGDWLLSKEVRRAGDWSFKRPTVEPSGWYFEYANEFYPDCDDTAKVLLALEHARASDPLALDASRERALSWLAAMQGADGGWAAFDVDNDAEILTHVPFADHNAMLDPSCADITGRALEALCGPGGGRRRSAIRNGVDYLQRVQEEDGSWYGRWGVNYLYGTCFALRGLNAAGVDLNEAFINQAGEWLRSVQNADGGWGETPGSYEDASKKGDGPSTPSQTAWALMGLIASGDHRSGSVESGIRYLLDTQNSDGSWEEEPWTGTGFPGVFYLRYHLYRQYFPLMALGEYAKVAR